MIWNMYVHEGNKFTQSVNVNGNFYLKSGAFNKLFDYYNNNIKHNLQKNFVGNIIADQLGQIVNNKDMFPFSELEDGNYKIIINAKHNVDSHKGHMEIDKLNIASDNISVHIDNDIVFFNTKPPSVQCKGMLMVTNYPRFIDIITNYAYRLGKYRFINNKARQIYAETNKLFVKNISDYPESNSNDLSISYDINTNQLQDARIGEIKLRHWQEIYQKLLLQNILLHFKNHKNILAQIEEFIPGFSDNTAIKDIIEDIQEKHSLPNKEKLKKLKDDIIQRHRKTKESYKGINTKY